jgi:2-polyprenyl-3-methyl-5-hydroxy-6-metoxy-1,4-benzoquinol methylase
MDRRTDVSLTPRQQREVEFHRNYAKQQIGLADQPVSLDVVLSARRRPWNAYWATYDVVRSMTWNGSRVLVVGCGFGQDAIRLASCGAIVHAVDISPDVVAIARRSAAKYPSLPITFDVAPAEDTGCGTAAFDAALFIDILHHVDITATMKEIDRVLKPSGVVIGDELYTHSRLQQRTQDRRDGA